MHSNVQDDPNRKPFADICIATICLQFKLESGEDDYTNKH